MATVKENELFARALLVQYPLDDAVDWIRDNMEPEDVFPEKALDAWAEATGWVKE